MIQIFMNKSHWILIFCEVLTKSICGISFQFIFHKYDCWRVFELRVKFNHETAFNKSPCKYCHWSGSSWNWCRSLHTIKTNGRDFEIDLFPGSLQIASCSSRYIQHIKTLNFQLINDLNFFFSGAIQYLGEPIKQLGYKIDDPENFLTSENAQFRVNVKGPNDKGLIAKFFFISDVFF